MHIKAINMKLTSNYLTEYIKIYGFVCYLIKIWIIISSLFPYNNYSSSQMTIPLGLSTIRLSQILNISHMINYNELNFKRGNSWNKTD